MEGAVKLLTVGHDLSLFMLVFGSLFLVIEIFLFHSLSDTHPIISDIFSIIILTSDQSDDDPKKDEEASEHEDHLHDVGRLDSV